MDFMIYFRGFIFLESPVAFTNCAGGRLVPLDPDIPLIDHRALANLEVDFSKYDMAVKATLLHNWPSQLVETRACK